MTDREILYETALKAVVNTLAPALPDVDLVYGSPEALAKDAELLAKVARGRLDGSSSEATAAL